MKKIINTWFTDLIIPLLGASDTDDGLFYYNLKINCEEKYRYVIREILLPDFLKLDLESREHAKLCLKYILTNQNFDVEREYEGYLPPFDLPNNPKDFFIWMWEEYFGEEEYILKNIEEYVYIEESYIMGEDYEITRTERLVYEGSGVNELSSKKITHS